jgi:formylglycine-generating enzyme required for sulfatase activity
MVRILAILAALAFAISVIAQPAQPKQSQSNELKPGEVRKVEIAKDVYMEFCWIPPGEAQLGSPKDEQDYIARIVFSGNRPIFLDHEAEFKRGKFRTEGFWLGKYPVTQAEWKALMGDNPSFFDGINSNKAHGLDTNHFPVEQISWDDCRKFLDKMNERNDIAKVFGGGKRFALPLEDQWEYACRGGMGNKRPYYWGNELNGTQANCNGMYPYKSTAKGQYLERTCAVDFTHEGKYERHPWGLMHMLGNIWQWCENTYEQTTDKVNRGGSWSSYGWCCRSAFRGRVAPGGSDIDTGFRVCLPTDK